MSTVLAALVQVFGCRHDEANPAHRRPASEKRQGTKSRWVVRGGCRGRYGDFAAGLGLLRLERCGRGSGFSSKDAGCWWKFVDRRLHDEIDGAAAGQFRGPIDR